MLKDEKLFRLAKKYNVAQFVSFSPHGKQRFRAFNHIGSGADVSWTIDEMLKHFDAICIRTFREDCESGNPFVFGVGNIDDALVQVNSFMSQGYHVILNEAISLEDNCSSGVWQDGLVEFAPQMTPRCVENEGCSSIPAKWAEKIFSILYGCENRLWNAQGSKHKRRFEFSIHANDVGYRKERLVVWEEGRGCASKMNLRSSDPFSRWLGNKAAGLLYSWLAGVPVPRFCVFRRGQETPLFVAGENTGTAKSWTRSCPAERTPGKYSTVRGFCNPHELMEKDGQDVVSAIVQDEVSAQYSGAGFCSGKYYNVEGVSGFGDRFMAGEQKPDKLPSKIKHDVRDFMLGLREAIHSPVAVEWAHDGKKVWLLQLHLEDVGSRGAVVVPGEAIKWFAWKSSDGLEKLRSMAAWAKDNECGITLDGGVGLMSHAADIARQFRVPCRLGD